jgi:polysaccharide deacetylase 2 family uncharacterized protein YibQ
VIVVSSAIVYLNRSGIDQLLHSSRINGLFAGEKDNYTTIFEAVNLALSDAGIPPSRWFNQEQGETPGEGRSLLVRTQVRAENPVERDLINYYTSVRLRATGGRVMRAREVPGKPWPGLQMWIGADTTLVRIIEIKPAPILKPTVRGPLVALIVDDFGGQMNDTIEGFINLDIPITIAVIPHTSFAGRVMSLAREAGREYIVHLPMEPREYPRKNPGSRAVLVNMSPGAIRNVVEDAVESLPGVAGMNNHMGSRATEYSEVMRAVMGVCLTYGLYFVDSMTSPRSVAYRVGREMGVETGHNELFLDNDPDESSIERTLDRLIRLSRQRGTAIGIAHPFASTHRVFRRLLPRYRDEGVTFVTVSELLAN